MWLTTRKIFLGRGKGTWEFRQKCNPPVAVYCNPLASFILLYFPTFIYYDPLFIRGPRVVALRKISYILGFTFNNYISFVNPSHHLILCSDGVYICKIKKNMVSCHAVPEKLLVEWLPKELWQLYIEWRWLDTVFLQEEFCQ